MNKFGIVYILHESKYPDRQNDIDHFMKKLFAQNEGIPQEIAILSNADYLLAVKILYHQGINRIIFATLLLFAAVHMGKDVTKMSKLLSDQLGF